MEIGTEPINLSLHQRLLKLSIGYINKSKGSAAMGNCLTEIKTIKPYNFRRKYTHNLIKNNCFGKFCLCGSLVLWKSGLVEAWSCGSLVLWKPCLVEVLSCGSSCLVEALVKVFSLWKGCLVLFCVHFLDS